MIQKYKQFISTGWDEVPNSVRKPEDKIFSVTWELLEVLYTTNLASSFILCLWATRWQLQVVKIMSVMDWRSSPWPCVLILFTVTVLFILPLWFLPGIHRTPGIRLYPSVSPQELRTIWHEKMFCTFISICNALF